MFFIRDYYGGGAEHDPRRKHYAEFKCTCCGELTSIDITGKEHQFDFNRERQCPNCKATTTTDYTEKLQAEIKFLTAQKSSIEVKIEECISKLNQLQCKEN